MKSKKWVDMDVDELKKESKLFRWACLISLTMCLVCFSTFMYRLLVASVFNNLLAFFSVFFFLMAIIYLIVRFHLDTLGVIKNLKLR